MPSLEQILDVLKLKPRYLIAIILFSFACLFIPENNLKSIGVFEFTQKNRHWIGIALLVSISLLIIEISIKSINVLSKIKRNRKRKKSILNNLHELTEEEKQILRYYHAYQSKTNRLRVDDGVVNGLVAKGIIYLAADRGTKLDGFDHNISDIAWKHLNENPELLSGETNTYRSDKRKSYF